MEGNMASKPQESLFYGKRPLVFMWIAHYDDNTSLPQFDPVDYHENKFSDIIQDKLIKFGLYPFKQSFATELQKHNIPAVSLPFLPKYEIKLDKFKRLIYHRENFISNEQFRICCKCGKEFQFRPGVKTVKSKYSSPICPSCGAHDYFVCMKCGRRYEIFEDAKGRDGHTPGLCNKCDSCLRRVVITSEQKTRERRWTRYHLGWQETVHGINKKNILVISENGDVEVISK